MQIFSRAAVSVFENPWYWQTPETYSGDGHSLSSSQLTLYSSPASPASEFLHLAPRSAANSPPPLAQPALGQRASCPEEAVRRLSPVYLTCYNLRPSRKQTQGILP